MRGLTEKESSLVLGNLAFVRYLVHKHILCKNQFEFDDYVSIGTFGLMKAAMTFDSARQVEFLTYAAKCIMNEINMERRKQKSLFENCRSLDDDIFIDSTSDNVFLYSMIEDVSSNFEEKLFEKEDFVETMEVVLNALPPKGRIILLFQIAGWTQNEIGSEVGISQSFLSRLIRRYCQLILKTKGTDYSRKIAFSIVEEEMYKISFSTNVKEFSKAFSDTAEWFMEFFPLPLPKYVVKDNRFVSIIFPSEKEYFSFLAKFFLALQ